MGEHVSNIVGIIIAMRPGVVEQLSIIESNIKRIYEGQLFTGTPGSQLNRMNQTLSKIRNINALARKSIFDSNVMSSYIEFRHAFEGGLLCYLVMGKEPNSTSQSTDYGTKELDLIKLFPIGKMRNSDFGPNKFNIIYKDSDTRIPAGAVEALFARIGNLIEIDIDMAEVESIGTDIISQNGPVKVRRTPNFNQEYPFVLKYVFEIDIMTTNVYGKIKGVKITRPAARHKKWTFLCNVAPSYIYVTSIQGSDVLPQTTIQPKAKGIGETDTKDQNPGPSGNESKPSTPNRPTGQGNRPVQGSGVATTGMPGRDMQVKVQNKIGEDPEVKLEKSENINLPKQENPGPVVDPKAKEEDSGNEDQPTEQERAQALGEIIARRSGATKAKVAAAQAPPAK